MTPFSLIQFGDEGQGHSSTLDGLTSSVQRLLRRLLPLQHIEGWVASRELARQLGSLGSGESIGDVLNYIPTDHGAQEAYTRMLHECWECARSEVEAPLQYRLHEPLTSAELGRLRYAHQYRAVYPWSQLGPRWGVGLSLYAELLPDRVERWFRPLMARIGLFQARTALAVSNMLKKVSDTYKKYGKLLSEHWKFVVNLETLGGYHKSVPMSEFVPELKQWAMGSAPHPDPTFTGMSESEFLFLYRKGIREFLGAAPSIADANLSAHPLSTWAGDPGLWGTTGATQYSQAIHVVARGREVRLHKSKHTTSFLLSRESVEAAVLRRHHSQILKPIQKVETGKVRAVVNVDDATYLKMAFVSDWLDRALDKHPATTLYMSSGQRQSMWQRLARRCSFATTKMPLDQSHFDWQVNKQMLAAMIDEIELFVRANCSVDCATRLRVIDTIRWTLVEDTGHIIVEEPSSTVSIPVQKGVMSGWRWTAMLDTLSNVGELAAANELASRLGFPTVVRSYIAQGDDDQVEVSSFAGGAALATAYKLLGFEVNPGKFFIDTERDEFLRQVPTLQEISGYPARAIHSILWRNPLSGDPPPGSVAVREQLSSWMLLIGRGLDPTKCWRHMLLDMLGRNKMFSRRTLLRYLLTPAAFGGAGLVLPGAQVPGRFAAIRERIDPATFRVITPLPGLKTVELFVAGKGWSKSIVQDAVASALPPSSVNQPRISATIIEPRPSVAKCPVPTSTSIPIQYVFDPAKIMHTIKGPALRYLVTIHDWDALYELAHPDIKPWFESIHRRFTLSAWTDWLLGKLPFNAPVIPGYSPEQVNVVWRRLMNGVMLEALNHSRVSRDYLRARAAAAVTAVPKLLVAYIPFRG